MENYQEYKSRLFEAFMDAQTPKVEVEYEEVEVEPIFLVSEDEELTEENTAVVIEDEELSEGLAPDERYANFNGHKVVINKTNGIIKRGKFEGKRVNLVKDKQRTVRRTYKAMDSKNDAMRRNPEDTRALNRRIIRSGKLSDEKDKERKDAHKEYDDYKKSIDNEKNPLKRAMNKISPSVGKKRAELLDKSLSASEKSRMAFRSHLGTRIDKDDYDYETNPKRIAQKSKDDTEQKLKKYRK